MCDLYSLTKGQQAIREFTRATRDTTGKLPPLPGIYPNSLAPVVMLAGNGGLQLTMMRWGMPCPPQFGIAPITNIRNTASPFWRRWLGPANRCLVPVTSFCEWQDTKPGKTPVWFALAHDRPLFAFAGIWTAWTVARGTKADQVTEDHLLFGFLTTDANADVAAVHPRAMPVILTDAEAMDAWMRAPSSEAASLQAPAPKGKLTIVARGEKVDN